MWRVGIDVAQWVDAGRDAIEDGQLITVGYRIPGLFPSYVRIMHPAYRYTYSGDRVVDAAEINWAEVARSHGRPRTGLSLFEDLFAPESPMDSDLAGPLEGQLTDRLCGRLAGTLAGHTSSPARCIFLFATSWGTLSPTLPDAVDLILSDGDYLAIGGSCDDACRFSITATMWWPVDRAWMVLTPVDCNYSFVGCSESAKDALIGNPGIEAWAVRRQDQI